MKVLLLLAFLTSCGMYNSRFDCPPGKGIGCQSVSQVLHLIVEREEGEDLFYEDLSRASHCRAQEHERSRKVVKSVEEERGRLFLLKERSGEKVLVQIVENQQDET